MGIIQASAGSFPPGGKESRTRLFEIHVPRHHVPNQVLFDSATTRRPRKVKSPCRIPRQTHGGRRPARRLPPPTSRSSVPTREDIHPCERRSDAIDSGAIPSSVQSPAPGRKPPRPKKADVEAPEKPVHGNPEPGAGHQTAAALSLRRRPALDITHDLHPPAILG